MAVTSEPLPLLLVRRGHIAADAIEALRRDRRLELFVVDDLTPEWLGFASRSRGIVVATSGEPLAAFVYALTAGVRVPVVVAAPAALSNHFRDAERAGAAGCIPLPIDKAGVDRVLDLLQQRGATAMVEADLRLVLDPVARVARYRKRSVRLTQREIAILHCLMSHRGQPVSTRDLYRNVWEKSAASSEAQQLVTVNVWRLRQKLGSLGVKGMLRNVRGFGYALVQQRQQRARATSFNAPPEDPDLHERE